MAAPSDNAPAAAEPAAAQPADPATATEALDQAGAAYEFGDIDLMVNRSRLVAEGALPGSDDQRAEALRLLGIGLYLSGRQGGAESVFTDLVKLRPTASLDPSTTRPEVVAFFRDVKRRNQPRKRLALAFLPPFGQFQNQTPVRGWILGSLEVATFAAGLTTRLVLADWVDANRLCRGGPDTGPCDRMRILNFASVGALTLTWAIGVVDALVGMQAPTEPLTPHTAATPQRPRAPRASLTLLPTGAALRLSF